MTKSYKGFAQIIIPIILALIVFVGTGYWAYKNGQIRFTSKEQSIYPTSTIDETANWKTYTNKAYGFSLKYPENRVFSGSDTLGFFKTEDEIERPRDNHSFAFNVIKSDINSYLKSLDNPNDISNYSEILDQKNVYFNENVFTKLHVGYTIGDHTEYVIEGKGFLIIFFVNTTEIDQILSTFKFIE